MYKTLQLKYSCQLLAVYIQYKHIDYHCVTGAVLTHDVMYPGFYFLEPPVSALYTNPQSPQNIHLPLFELYTTPEGGNI